MNKKLLRPQTCKARGGGLINNRFSLHKTRTDHHDEQDHKFFSDMQNKHSSINIASTETGNGRIEIQKILPHRIKIDKENLYQENIYLKKKIHTIEKEVIRLKTKVKAEETKAHKYLMILKEIQESKPNQKMSIVNRPKIDIMSHLLKDENEKLKKEIEGLNQQLNQYKAPTNNKGVKYHELALQNQNLNNEINRLSQKISNNNNKSPKKESLQKIPRKGIKNKLIESLESKVLDRDKQISNVKLLLIQRERELSQSRKQNQMNLKKIEQLELKHQKEMNVLIRKITKLNGKSNVSLENDHLESQLQSNISHTAEYLCLKLQGEHIEMKSIINFFKDNEKATANIQAISKEDIIKVFSQPPLLIYDENDRLNFCNFLIGDKFFLKKKKQEKIEKIIQRFWKALGNYDLLTEQQQDKIYLQVIAKLANEIDDLYQMLLKFSKHTFVLPKEDFVILLRLFKLNELQIKFVITLLSLESVDIYNINFRSLMQLFTYQEQRQINEAVEQLPSDLQKSSRRKASDELTN